MNTITDAGYKQIERGTVGKPLIYPIADLHIDPIKLSQSLDIRFEDTTEGDDKIKVAFIEISSGRQFVLYTYPEDPAFDNNLLINGIIDAPGTGEELEDFLNALKIDKKLVGWHRDWKMDLEEFKTKWRLWRQDDNGNKMVIKVFPTEAEAEEKRREFEAKGHKQIYWIDKAGSL